MGAAGRLLAFDSGIGGLSVVAALRTVLPGTPIDYLADNEVFPYGELADAVLIRRVETLMESALARLRPDAVVIACNTASTVALEPLRARFGVPFIGCVPPIKWAADISRSRHIGLLATRATVRRPYLRMLTERFAPDCTLIAHGAAGLAAVAELAFRDRPVDDDAIAGDLSQLFGQPGGGGDRCRRHRLHPLQLPAGPVPPAVSARHRLARPGGGGREAGSQRARGAGGPGSRPGGPGEAWFTAPPADDARLLSGLSRFGYDRILPFGIPVSAAG